MCVGASRPPTRAPVEMPCEEAFQNQAMGCVCPQKSPSTRIRQPNTAMSVVIAELATEMATMTATPTAFGLGVVGSVTEQVLALMA